ncbi:fatty acid desaturase, partial [bacterium]|nr:fatty acid desaturase [bacterium]
MAIVAHRSDFQRRPLKYILTATFVSKGIARMRDGKQLLIASKDYAHENRWQSWWHLGSTLAAFATVVPLIFLPLHWLIVVPFSVVLGLLLVRMFVLYHDYEHGAILSRSRLADWIMMMGGLIVLSPRSIWNRSHNHHHKSNSKSFGNAVGTYPLMTVDDFAKATRWDRLMYAASRSPLNIAMGYFTIFLFGMCLRPLILNPRKHYDCAIALLMHFSLIGLLVVFFGWSIALLAVMIPFAVAGGLGSYLFYAQHNFPGLELRHRAEWSHVFAALHSSSYIRMNSVMNWFTGNIGYHHVHHCNSKIPFYRLPEAMAGIEELKLPCVTSLNPKDIV